MTTRYKHTQTGTLILVLVMGMLFLLALISTKLTWHPLLLVGLLLLFVIALLFYSLTVEIKDDFLECYFGPGLIRKKFKLEEIRDAQAVRNRWIYGWGIRLTPHGWMFNVSGLDAVEIHLTSGKRFRIGTDRPEELKEAICQNAPLITSS